MLHIEMAITNSIWRIYLKEQDTGSGVPLDPHSIFPLCSLICPHDSRKLATGPGHQMTHHAINYTLIALIAEAWHTAVWEKYKVSLQDWRPKWDDILSMSHKIVRNHVADLTFVPLHCSLPSSFDMVEDARKLFARDALLWFIVRHAARHGDIGCLENTLPYWICIWKHKGKNKYAEHITRFLLNLQISWPEKFAHAVQMNWLINLTGKKDGFRGADWVIESNNLMHKVVHAGRGAN
jgi:hypothetical protein